MSLVLLKDVRSAIILEDETNFSESLHMEGRRKLGAVEVGTGRSLGNLHASVEAVSRKSTLRFMKRWPGVMIQCCAIFESPDTVRNSSMKEGLSHSAALLLYPNP
jgi:hypothetical protein